MLELSFLFLFFLFFSVSFCSDVLGPRGERLWDATHICPHPKLAQCSETKSPIFLFFRVTFCFDVLDASGERLWDASHICPHPQQIESPQPFSTSRFSLKIQPREVHVWSRPPTCNRRWMRCKKFCRVDTKGRSGRRNNQSVFNWFRSRVLGKGLLESGTFEVDRQ